jgi:para-nitrobenzyl esterase
MKNTGYWAFVSILLLSFSTLSNAANPNDNIADHIVQTKQGQVRGTIENGICVWKGIRYAQAPVGDLRFRAPQAVEPWPGVKDALQFGSMAPQTKSRLTNDGTQSEDCLFLNVWSPAADGKKRPVMFWIHGGGFVIGEGSASLYNGTPLAKKGDVVVVTINYRLGPLGFLYFNNKPGFDNNLGILDQIAALKWVKENIAAFGGDPETVTIFGESAGGTSVETLLSTKAAKGLFKRAIAESGPPAILWSNGVADSITRRYLSILHIPADSLQLLKQVPVDTLMAAEDKLLNWMIDETNNKVFSPTIDGKLITQDIFKCMKPDIGGEVELMIGTNKNESTMFARKDLHMVPDNSKGLEKYFDEMTTKESKLKVTKAYAKYPNKTGVLDILTDAVFRIPAVRLAECRSMYAPVYMYRFEWSSSILNTLGLGSFHGLEIPFVFGNHDGRLGKYLKLIATKKLVHRLTGEMQGAWLNFAKYGNPNGKDAGDWKPYTTDNRATMIFSKHSKLVVDPEKEHREAWEGVVYY